MTPGARVKWGQYQGTITATGIASWGAWCSVEVDNDAFGDLPWSLLVTLAGDELEAVEVL